MGYSRLSPERDFRDILVNHRDKTAKEIGVRYWAGISGLGGGARHKIDKAYIDFSVNRSLDIDTARKIVVDATETLAKYLNEDPRLTEHLAVYPCSIETVEITADCFRMKKSDFSELSYASVIHGNIHFKKFQPKEEEVPQKSETLLIEPYEESRKIVMEQLGPGGATWIPDDWRPDVQEVALSNSSEV
jgi:hypothetical protein